MNKFFLYVMLSFAVLFSSSTFAQEATEATKHEQAVAEAQKQLAPSVKQSEYVTIANGLSDAITQTAHKLNVELQDFATSPLGIFTMLVIVYKVAGNEISQWASVLYFTFFGVVLWVWWARKTFGEYNEKGKFVKFVWHSNREDAPVGAFIAAVSGMTILITIAALLP